MLECQACTYAEGLTRQDEARAALAPNTLHGLAFAHPATFTFGRHATAQHLLVAEEFLVERGVAVVRTERGGEVTFHGPGQLVLYPLFRLGTLAVKRWVWLLEEALILTVKAYGVVAKRGKGPGIFANRPGTCAKLGFIGLRVRDGISTHGISLNLNNDLAPFSWMNPCGATALAITSIERETGTAPEWRDCARAYMDTLAALLVGERA